MKMKEIEISSYIKTYPSYIFESLLKKYIYQIDKYMPPISYAIGTCLFIHLGNRETLEKIFRIVDSELENIGFDPNNETDLENKIILLVTYNKLCQYLQLQPHIPSDVLNNYFVYAESEQWFGSFELALFTKLFASDFVVNQYISNFAESRFQENIANDYLIGGSICIKIREGILVNSEKFEYIEKIESLLLSHLSINQLSWNLVALSSMNDSETDKSLSNRLEEIIDKHMTELNNRIKSDLYTEKEYLHLVNIIHRVAYSTHEIEIGEFTPSSDNFIEDININDRDITIRIVDTPPQQELLNISLPLALLAISNSDNDKIVGIIHSKGDELKELVENAEHIKTKEVILIKNTENIVINICALFLILIGGSIILFYNAGGKASLDFSNIEIDKVLKGGLILFAIITIGIVTFIRTNSIVHALFEIPHIGKIFEKIISPKNE